MVVIVLVLSSAMAGNVGSAATGSSHHVGSIIESSWA